MVYFQVVSPWEAIIEIQDDAFTVRKYTQAALRDTIGNSGMDFVLTEREQITENVKRMVRAATGGWGVDVESIKIQKFELPGEMKRAGAGRSSPLPGASSPARRTYKPNETFLCWQRFRLCVASPQGRPHLTATREK